MDCAVAASRVPAMSAVLDACRGLPTRTFATGEVVIEDGASDGVLYVLASGSVEIGKGGVQITTVADPGAFLGEMSVLLAMPHTAMVRALEPSAFQVVDQPFEFFHAHPAIAFEVA